MFVPGQNAFPSAGRQNATATYIATAEVDGGKFFAFPPFEAAGAFRFRFDRAVRVGEVATGFGFALAPFRQRRSARSGDRSDREDRDEAEPNHP